MNTNNKPEKTSKDSIKPKFSLSDSNLLYVLPNSNNFLLIFSSLFSNDSQTQKYFELKKKIPPSKDNKIYIYSRRTRADLGGKGTKNSGSRPIPNSKLQTLSPLWTNTLFSENSTHSERGRAN
ncbi:hypothetical protein AABB24_007011 [Solanum stoloniferum]|uniref:Uncharacterized protein n=1 Tax=Solanum stoloniferum TaxID=62892 RepID=A0ABD2UMP7_9SOLN